MKKSEAQVKINNIIQSLPEAKLKILLDFTHFLQDNKEEDSEDLFQSQMSSKAYQEWLSSENDVYDEVFQDESE